MPWQVVSNYDYTKSHTIKDWGWEFIRRNPTYIAEWKEALARIGNKPNKLALWLPHLRASEVSQYKSPPHCTDAEDVDNFLIPSDKAMKWGLCSYQNPESHVLNKDALASVRMIAIGKPSLEPEPDEISVNREQHTLITVIDLKIPLMPQIESIEAEAKKRQEELKNDKFPDLILKSKSLSPDSRAIWTTYIRCLDAKKSGMKRKIAASRLFPEYAGDNYFGQSPEDKWDETLKQAQSIVKEGYRSFML